jgi:hypothetical protein
VVGNQKISQKPLSSVLNAVILSMQAICCLN